MKTCLILLLGLSLALTGCAAAEPLESAPESVPALTEAPSAATEAPETEPPISEEQQILNSLSLREKVGQLFIVRPDALDLSIPFSQLDNSAEEGVTGLTDSMKQTLGLYPVGGFIHFQKNIVDPGQIQAFNRQLSDALYVKPFLAVDEEGGLVARLARAPSFGLPRFESAAAVGARGENAAGEMGTIIGMYLKENGFNMDFAPVADVNTNENNPVIGTRAFSSDPYEAAACARAMADGLQNQGIIPVFKHFPGHGDTAEDSHRKIALSHKDREALENCEWIPFRQAGALKGIMVGHIALPEITGNMTPATLSPEIVTGCLKEELSYEGLIITDSLSMGAILDICTPGEAALQALHAGCEILLMPASLEEAFDTVLAAVEEGSFPEDRLDEIVLKILRVKLANQIIPS